MDSSNPSIPGTINPPPGLPVVGAPPPPPPPPNVGSLLGSKENSPSFDSALGGRTVALRAPPNARFPRVVSVNVVVNVFVVVKSILPLIYYPLSFLFHPTLLPCRASSRMINLSLSLVDTDGSFHENFQRGARVPSRRPDPRRRRRVTPAATAVERRNEGTKRASDEGLERRRRVLINHTVCTYKQGTKNKDKRDPRARAWGARTNKCTACPNFIYFTKIINTWMFSCKYSYSSRRRRKNVRPVCHVFIILVLKKIIIYRSVY